MKIRDYVIEDFFRGCIRILAGGVMMAMLFTATACQRREAEFLKETEASADVTNTEETPDGDEVPDGEASPDGDEVPDGDALVAGEASPDIDTEPEQIFVDVCGAVASPGVFRLEAGSRVFQAVESAGGLLAEAAGEYVNLAGRLEDGQQIYIPTREEAESISALKSPLENAVSGGLPGNESPDAGQTEPRGKINLNTADESALTTLTGIGASKAQAILAYREEHGSFAAIEEILNVPGIKEGTFMKIKDNIAVE